MAKILLIAFVLFLLSAQPARGAIECDGRAEDTLCHVHMPMILEGKLN